MKKLFASLFVTAFVLLASACGGGGVYNTVGTQKLTTSQSSYTMSVGQTEMVVVYGVYDTRALQATAEPSAICSVAGKTENVFHVSGHSAGKCTVTITTEAYQTLKVGVEVFRAVQAPLMATNWKLDLPAGQSMTSLIYGGSNNGPLKAYSTNGYVCKAEIGSGNTLTVIGVTPGYCQVTVIKEGDGAFYPRNIVLGGYISVPAEKLEQEALVASMSKFSWNFMAPPVYTATNVAVYGGSGGGGVSATTSDPEICTVSMTGDKDKVNGGDIITISGSGIKAGTCKVIVTKAGDYVYNPTSVTIEVVITDVIVTPTPVAPEVPQ